MIWIFFEFCLSTDIDNIIISRSAVTMADWKID